MKKKNRMFLMISFIAAISLISSLVVTATPPQKDLWDAFKIKYHAQKSNIIFHPITKLPQEIQNLEITLPGLENIATINERNVVVSFSRFIEDNQNLFKIKLLDLKLRKARRIKSKWYVTYEQYYQKIPIYQVKVGAVITDKGKIVSFASNYIPDVQVNITPKIDEKKASNIALDTYKSNEREGLTVKDSSLIIYLQAKEDKSGYKFCLAWKFLMQGKKPNPNVDQYFFIDAHTGALLLKYPAFVQAAMYGTVQGQIFPALPTDALVTRNFANETVQVVGGGSGNTNATGFYSITSTSGTHTITSNLEGPFASASDYNSGAITHTQTGNTSSPTNWTWTENPSTTVDETDPINVFYHLNLIHDQFYQNILGYSWTNAWTSSTQMQAQANYPDFNAYAGSPMLFGSDCFARSSDIIYHEATHNVIYDVFGNWIGFTYGTGTEGYAMDEGFADYFACAFTNDSHQGEGCGAGRNLDNTMQYPVPYSGEGHTNGQIIAGAVWDLRTDFGLAANTVDSLAFEALNDMATYPAQYYFSDPNHSNFFSSILRADDNNSNLADGTPHDREIFQAFRNHGLLPYDVYCRDSNSDDGNVPSPGAFWTSPDIMVDASPYYAGPGDPTHENPVLGSLNKVHIRVRNSGYLTVNQCKVKLYWANPSTGLTWPGDWHYIDEAMLNNIQPLTVDADGEKAIIDWTPVGTGTGHRCLLVRLECSDDIITEEGKVPLDNNISQKNIEIVSPSFFQVQKYVEIYIHPLAPELKVIRNLKVIFINAPEEIKVVFQVPEQIKIGGAINKARLVKKTIEKPWFEGKVLSEITVLQRDKEFLIPKFSSRRMVPIRFFLFMPEKFLLTKEFTMRIVEERNGKIVGGIDYIVRSKS